MRSLTAITILAFGACLAASALPATAAPLTFTCDPGHTAVRASWTHAGFSTQSAGFHKPECTLVLDEADPTKSSLSVKIMVASINTGVPDLDADIKSANFFDAAKNPEITFASTSVTVKDKTAEVVGNLTMHGISKPATLKVSLVNMGEHPVGQFFDYYKGKWAGFDASTTIKRSDFGMNMMVPVVSDDITISISTEMKGQ